MIWRVIISTSSRYGSEIIILDRCFVDLLDYMYLSWLVGYWCPLVRSYTHCVCLFVLVFFFGPNREIYHSYRDVTITCEGLQILTYAQYVWPLSSEGSLACHTYWDTGHPLIMVISEEPWHSYLLPSVKQWGCHYLFLQLSVAAGIQTPILPLVGTTL